MSGRGVSLILRVNSFGRERLLATKIKNLYPLRSCYMRKLSVHTDRQTITNTKNGPFIKGRFFGLFRFGDVTGFFAGL